MTPKQDLPSPCQLLMGRRLRSTLPVAKKVLKPQYPLTDVRKNLQSRQVKQKNYYDQHSKILPKLNQDQPVLMQNDTRSWKPAIVVRKYGPNDYLVKTEDTEYRRNRKLLKPLRTSTSNVVQDYVESERSVKISDQESREPIQGESVVKTHLETVRQDSESNQVKPVQNFANMKPPDSDKSQRATRSGRLVKPPAKLDL